MTSKVDKARAWDAIRALRDAEREHCAEIAERLADQGRDGYQIAKVIRAGKRPSPSALDASTPAQRLPE